MPAFPCGHLGPVFALLTRVGRLDMLLNLKFDTQCLGQARWLAVMCSPTLLGLEASNVVLDVAKKSRVRGLSSPPTRAGVLPCVMSCHRYVAEAKVLLFFL